MLVVQPETGKRVQRRRPVSAEYFGEGIVDWGPNLYEWTWQSHICFVYDRFTLRLHQAVHLHRRRLGHDAHGH